jgi:hypothetical protein
MSVFGIAYKSGIPTYSQQQALMYIPAPPIQNPPGDTVKFSGASKFIANPYGDHWALIDIQTSSDIFQNINRFTVLDEKMMNKSLKALSMPWQREH